MSQKNTDLISITAEASNHCFVIFIPVLKFIFNVGLSQRSFPTLWKQAALVPVFIKGNGALASNYRLISILSTFSKRFEFVIHEHVSYYLRTKFNSCQHGFIKSQYTSANLVTHLGFSTPLVYSQRQVDAICFDFSNAFDRVPHELLLRNRMTADCLLVT
jgi:hypothetical protein